MNIVLIGTGNVAVVLSRLLVSAGHSIVEVIGRDTLRHQIFHFTGGEFKTNYSTISPDADLYLIAVSDNAIADVANKLPATKALVVHTSGATSKEVLNRFENYGVLYPLQSLRKEMKEVPSIPFFVDANTDENCNQLFGLAHSTGNTVNMANDKQRLLYHLAAVLSSNFTNHLYSVTEAFCKKENLDFKNLLPLINETVQRLQFFSPSQMQTGPAIRNDSSTIERHLAVLQSFPDLQNLYQIMTGSIQNFGKNSEFE